MIQKWPKKFKKNYYNFDASIKDLISINLSNDIFELNDALEKRTGKKFTLGKLSETQPNKLYYLNKAELKPKKNWVRLSTHYKNNYLAVGIKANQLFVATHLDRDNLAWNSDNADIFFQL